MKGLIMAGGEGTRLKPLTCTAPKPMMTLLDRPVMEYIIAHMREQGITEIASTLHYLPSAISNYFKDGKEYGVNLSYYLEDTPLGTAGSVKNAEEFLDEDFIVISGDAMCDINLRDAASFHYDNNADVTIILSRVKNPLEYGTVLTDKTGRITRFIEKPAWEEVLSDWVNTGIYIIRRSVLDLIPKNKPFDFSRDLFPLMLKNGNRLFGYQSNGYWCDMGDLSAYLTCHYDLLNGTISSPLLHQLRKTGELRTTEKGNIYIGIGATVAKGAFITPNSSIEGGCIVERGARVASSVLLSGARLDPYARAEGSIIGRNTILQQNACCTSGSVVGDNCIIGEGAEIMQNIKIWNGVSVPPYENVYDNLLYKNSASLHIGESHIEGGYNISLTPTFCARLGGAVGGLFGGVLILGNDGSPPSVSLADAVCSGLLCSGRDVIIIDNCSRGELCYHTKIHDVPCGIFVHTNMEGVRIELYDDRGLPLSASKEKKLESLLKTDRYPRPATRGTGKKSPLLYHDKAYIAGIIDYAGGTVRTDLSIQRETGNPLFSAVVNTLTSAGCNLLSPSSPPYVPRPAITVGAEGIVLTDEAGQIIKEEQLSLLISAIYLKLHPGASIPLTPYMPQKSEEFLFEFGGSGIRCNEHYDGLSQEENDAAMLLRDPVYCSLLIAKGISMGLNLSEISSKLPKTAAVRKEIFCTPDCKAKILSALQDENLNNNDIIISGSNRILIVPHPTRSSFKIFAESSKMEIAEEICNIYEEKIKKLQK